MMDVTYEAIYDSPNKPRLCKVVTAPDGERVPTALSLSNTEELDHLSEELLWEHMVNLVEYLKEASQRLTMVPVGVQPNDGWPVLGWHEIYRTHEEIMSWWIYVINRDETFEVIHHVTIQP